MKGYNLDTKCAAHFPFVTRKDLYEHACRWLSYRHDCWWLLQIVWFDRWKLDCFFFTSTGKDLLTFASHDIIIMVADDCYTDMLAGDCWRLFDQIGSNWLPSDYSQPVKAASTFHMERILIRIGQILPLLISRSFSYDLFSSIETWLLQDCPGLTPVYEPNLIRTCVKMVFKNWGPNERKAAPIRRRSHKVLEPGKLMFLSWILGKCEPSPVLVPTFFLSSRQNMGQLHHASQKFSLKNLFSMARFCNAAL